jgi:formylglycine-generating enzyme required for sulfatase activity
VRARAVAWGALALASLAPRAATSEVGEARGAPAASLTDHAGIRLVRVPAGEFLMGSNEKQDDVYRTRFWRSAPPERDDLDTEKPQHRVRISRPFYLGATEVTVGQFKRFVHATGYQTDAERGGGGRGFDARGGKDHGGDFATAPKYTWKSPGFTQGDEHPVVLVSWNDAVAFTAWLSREEKARYRLPTEAEWEYACRAGTETWLGFGDDPTLVPRHANLADASLEKAHPGRVAHQRVLDASREAADGWVYTAPVASFPANAFGLFDMHGNVWEWCNDRYQRGAYHGLDRTTTVDPTGPDAPDEAGDLRVLRGGSWYVDMVSARSSARLWGARADAFCYAGFRVVREP